MHWKFSWLMWCFMRFLNVFHLDEILGMIRDHGAMQRWSCKQFKLS